MEVVEYYFVDFNITPNVAKPINVTKMLQILEKIINNDLQAWLDENNLNENINKSNQIVKLKGKKNDTLLCFLILSNIILTIMKNFQVLFFDKINNSINENLLISQVIQEQGKKRS